MPQKLVLVCGPSGSGKTSIVHHLLARIPALSFSVSATTRARRKSESDGVDYHFLSVEEFKKRIDAGEFLEWEQVYKDGYYGTLHSEIRRIAAQGHVAVFDVDVEGGLAIRNAYPHSLLDIFVRPPGIAELKQRLHARATEDGASFRARVHKAELELTYSNRFTHTIINRDFEAAAAEAEKLVLRFLEVEMPPRHPARNA